MDALLVSGPVLGASLIPALDVAGLLVLSGIAVGIPLGIVGNIAFRAFVDEYRHRRALASVPPHRKQAM